MAGQPSGGIIGVDFGNWTLDTSLGVYNGSAVGGAAVKTHIGTHSSVEIGDQAIEVGIPTQTEFNAQVLARGASLSYAPTQALQVKAFAGMAGAGYASTNVFYFEPQIPLGALSIDYALDAKKRMVLFTRALFSNQQTLLGGFLYRSKQLQTGFAVGTGSNQPHAEGLFRYAGQQWEIREQYLYSGNRFQLLTLPQFRISQEDRENLDVRWSPWKETAFTLGHHEYLNPATAGASTSSAAAASSFTRGSMDSAGGMFTLHRIGLGADAYESRFEGVYGSAASFFASERLNKTLSFNENYYVPLHSTNPASTSVVTASENLNRRLNLTEFATRANGQWSLNYGGGLHWDWTDVNLGYSTNFIPLAAGGGRFEQSMDVNGHINVGRLQFGISTYVQPNGKLLYAYEIKSFYFHPLSSGKLSSPSMGASMEFPNFVVVGHVTQEGTGKPVADTPVLVGDETVYTDDTGAFSLHVTRKHAYKIHLVLDHQIDSQYFEQVSGPAEIVAGTEKAPGEAEFVVRIDPQRTSSTPKGGIMIVNPGVTLHSNR